MAKDFLKSLTVVQKVSAYQAKAQKSIAERTVEAFAKEVATFKAGDTEGRRYIKANGDKIELSVKAGNQYLKLDGENTKFSIPKAQLDVVAEQIKASILAGDYDKELQEIDLAQKERGQALSATRQGAVAAPKTTRGAAKK